MRFSFPMKIQKKIVALLSFPQNILDFFPKKR